MKTVRQFYFFSILLLVLATGCSQVSGDGSTCSACHQGLELVSESHLECVSCHGGDPEETDEKASHQGMYGPKNPADPKHWDKTCGRCHPRVNLSQPTTPAILST
jgi:hypothetical protein